MNRAWGAPAGLAGLAHLAALALPAALALLAALAFLAAPPAGAVPRTAPVVAGDVPSGTSVALGVRAAGGRVSYHGGPVLHSNRTHLIFWQPAGSGLSFDPGYTALTERFLSQVAAASRTTTNVYGLTGQYRGDGAPAAYASTYGGAVLDTDALPGNACHEPSTAPADWTTCLTDDQLQAEIEHVIAADHLPGKSNDIYFLVTPNRFGSCLDSSSSSCALGGADNGYCGYHEMTDTGILYAVIPYNAISGHCNSAAPRPNRSTADPVLSTIEHEQSETVTDPDGNAWSAGDGEEIADLCLQHFGANLGGSGASAWNEAIDGAHYYLQELWSNDTGGCTQRASPDHVSLSAPARALAGRPVSFKARASDPHGSIVAYTWSFGGGGTSHRRLTSHVFRRAGVYKILLRVTDSAGNWTVAARRVRVRL